MDLSYLLVINDCTLVILWVSKLERGTRNMIYD